MERRAVLIPGPALSGGRGDTAAAPGPAAAHPDLGWWNLAAQAALPPGGALDGVFPGGLHGNLTLDEIREMVGFMRSQRPSGAPIDVMVGGDVPFDNVARARDILADYAAAGVTWWVEGIGEWRGDIDAMARFIQGGPPGR